MTHAEWADSERQVKADWRARLVAGAAVWEYCQAMEAWLLGHPEPPLDSDEAAAEAAREAARRASVEAELLQDHPGPAHHEGYGSWERPLDFGSSPRSGRV